VLATLLAWARRSRPADPVELVLLGGGALRPELDASLPAPVIGSGVRTAAGWAAAGFRSVGRAGPADPLERITDRWALRRCRDADTVLANTLAALPAAAAACGDSARLVCWVHELDGVADRVLPPGSGRDAIVARVDRFLAAGPAVVDMLVGRWGVAPGRVVRADPFVDDPTDGPRPAGESARAAPLLLGVGAIGARKGTDRFVDLLASWPDGPDAPRGRWVGGDAASPAAAEARADIGAAGIGHRLELTGEVSDTAAHLDQARALVSVAREDPFPLAVLEAGVRGLVVAGTDSGGLSSLLADAGCADLVVGPGDLLGLRRVLDGLLSDPDRAATAGAALRGLVRDRHVTERAAPVVWSAVLDREVGP
jgi:glycosyltransferase involved in cell wall biosynthesis